MKCTPTIANKSRCGECSWKYSPWSKKDKYRSGYTVVKVKTFVDDSLNNKILYYIRIYYYYTIYYYYIRIKSELLVLY